MRLGALVVVAIVAWCCACVHHDNGTYLSLASANDTTIEFDQVDFYVGTDGGYTIPTSPLNPTPVARPNSPSRFSRTFVTPDEWIDPSGHTHTSYAYYLPDNTVDAMLGAYVLVIVSLKGTPVGIGELQNFQVVSTGVDNYGIELVKWPTDATAEQWGPNKNDCARWQRVRPSDTTPSTRAVVTGNDKDCDGFADAVDCNEYLYCDATHTAGCTGETACVIDTPACALGTCTNYPADPAMAMGCGGAEICLYAAACSTECAAMPAIDDRLQCATKAADEGRYEIPVNADNTLCAAPESVEIVSISQDCVNPTILSPPNGVASDGFMFAVTVNTTQATCEVTITPPAGPAVPFDAHYILFSIDGSGTYAHTTYGFSIVPNSSVACLVSGLDAPAAGSAAVCGPN